MTEQEQIAQFIATRGVTRVAAGESTYDRRSMYLAVRGERSDVDPVSQRITREDGHGREYITNGLGELIYVDEGYGR